MAKGNMLLGYSRGSVGDVTFYRSGGSQRQRARNRNPKNPRTEAQMSQRSKFANAVKFFKQANSGFFKFAFEDMKTNESDYNAFMRHNLVNSGYIGAQASKISNWPALGLWQMSAGSLPEITAPFPQPESLLNNFYFDLGVNFGSYDVDAAQTIGLLSNFLINNSAGVWREGDIVTIAIYTINNKNLLPTVDIENNLTAEFGYLQFILNSSDNSPLSSVKKNIGGIDFSISATNDYEVGFCLYNSLNNNNTNYYSACVIHSRNTSNGLYVSDSYLVSVDQELNYLAMSDSGTYYNSVIADWDATQNAILQGKGISGGSSSGVPYSLHFQGGYVDSYVLPGSEVSVTDRAATTSYVISCLDRNGNKFALNTENTVVTGWDNIDLTVFGNDDINISLTPAPVTGSSHVLTIVVSGVTFVVNLNYSF